jgi:hypothetical protein
LHDDAILPGRKLGVWRAEVTEEHQEPALAVEGWIRAGADTISVDDVVHRLLLYPSVVITRREEADIPNAYRRGGVPEDRYREAGIEPVLVEEGTAKFFESRIAPGRTSRKGRYYVEPSPFDD